MKFIRLEIKNLASLDRPEGEVIEFEKGPLAGSTIFSIVGPTGSGKSTILDAICLALFNRTPRYPRAKNDRNQSIEIYGAKDKDENARLAPTDSRNILTRGKREGYSRLTFLANDGTLWRAEWTVRKNRIRFEQAQRSLYRITVKPDGTTVEEPADSNSIPTIIGLDYDQFLRTVVLAQGSFANFLTAKEDERYMLLEKLVGCDTMYSRISDEITQRKKTALTNL
ncbi:AAA family ATPase, partial [Paramuribaculum intestinale]